MRIVAEQLATACDRDRIGRHVFRALMLHGPPRSTYKTDDRLFGNPWRSPSSDTPSSRGRHEAPPGTPALQACTGPALTGSSIRSRIGLTNQHPLSERGDRGGNTFLQGLFPLLFPSVV
jgi:hypothetical protein